MSEKKQGTKSQKIEDKNANKTKPKRERAPLLSASDAVVGSLDSKERAPQAAMTEETPLMATDPAVPTTETPNAEPAAPHAPEPLRLPKGAFLALRKSGGLKFSTRELVVYPDGRIAFDSRGVPQKEYNRLRRALNDAQVLALRKLLDQTGFWQMKEAGKQNPDAFAYEIAARMGQRANVIEVFDGSVPEKLGPLLERLNKLLPQE